MSNTQEVVYSSLTIKPKINNVTVNLRKYLTLNQKRSSLEIDKMLYFNLNIYCKVLSV